MKTYFCPLCHHDTPEPLYPTWFCLLTLILCVGCTDLNSQKDVEMPTAARLYSNYKGECKLVFDLGGKYAKTEMTIEGKCK